MSLISSFIIGKFTLIFLTNKAKRNLLIEFIFRYKVFRSFSYNNWKISKIRRHIYLFFNFFSCLSFYEIHQNPENV